MLRKNILSIFRVEESAKQEATRKLDPEDGGGTFMGNVGELLLHCTAYNPRR
jgi:hypothetical protein